jgi:archaellum component FlaG (FlaF/FlaG flagellin family)
MGKSGYIIVGMALTLCALSLYALSATGTTTPATTAPIKVFGVTLTPAQADQFKTIYTAEQPAMKAIRDNAALSAADKKSQLQAIYEKIKEQLKAILTPDQIAQMEKPATTTSTTTPVKVFGVTLTPAQAVQFKAFCDAEQPAEQAIRDNAALSADQKHTQMQAIYDKIKQQLKAILTPDQIAQMEKPATTTSTAPVKVFGVTLTPAQAIQFKAFCDAAQPAEKTIRDNAALSASEKHAQMLPIYEKIKQQLKAILTPDQIAEMDKPSSTTTKK